MRGSLVLATKRTEGTGPARWGTTSRSLIWVQVGRRRPSPRGTTTSCALLDHCQVKCWGYNFWGNLGLGDKIYRGDGPGEMGDSLPIVDLGTGRTAIAIAAGRNYTCALLDTRQVKYWRYNNDGQLGVGDKVYRGDGPGEMGDNLPIVALGAGRTAKGISAGRDHTCALLDDDELKWWGNNGDGQLGLGDKNSRGLLPNHMGDQLPAVLLWSGPSP
jgi:E3 ubiquitin-protein ligase HERC3